MKLANILSLATLVAGLAVVSSPVASEQPGDSLRERFRRPTEIPFPQTAPYSLHIATLGKMLFYDPRLSGAQNMNCASCHNPSFGYETPVPTAIGAANVPLGRHAPTLLNHAWTPRFFWDGRAASLEEQAAGPITASVEMNGKFPEIIARLKDIDEYRKWFERLFPDKGISRETILKAIATYERTVVSGVAPFDRWVEGDEDAMTDEAKRGFELFVGKAGCSECHSGWNFTDSDFHDIGLATEDIGRAQYEPQNALARHAFKTPGLRNLTYRAPFMHNGSLSDLEAVIAHYESGGIERPSLAPSMPSFELTDGERADLLAFMRSLTAEKADTPIPVLPN
ncbi:MAG: cytochrome-c peroxidase [Hyphomicrobiales bacterium]